MGASTGNAAVHEHHEAGEEGAGHPTAGFRLAIQVVPWPHISLCLREGGGGGGGVFLALRPTHPKKS